MSRRYAGWGLGLLAGLVLGGVAQAADDLAGLAADAELVEARSAVPKLKAAATYEPANSTVHIDLSEYAGYAGLLVANRGLDPNEDSLFFKKYGFKVKITFSEEDNWSPVNAGELAASASTVDVLPLYGKQLEAVVPVLISFSRGADAIVVKDSIKTVNDLKGKTLATGQFNESDFFIRYMAQQAGLGVNLLPDLKASPDPEKVNLVVCADSFGAGDLFLRDVRAGRNRVAGCVTWEPKTSEVVDGSKGKSKVLVSNRNLLIVADILVVNRGFAERNPDMVRGLVEGILEGNQQVRSDPQANLDLICKAFKWKKEDAPGELAKVHLANFAENMAFFAGTIDSAGSYNYIYESAGLAYGPSVIRSAYNGEKFLDLKALKALEAEGRYKGQKADIKPIRTAEGGSVEEPLLSRDIRFLFQPNSSKLNLEEKKNLDDLAFMARMLQVSPGSTLLLRGHVDNARVPEFQKQGGPDLVRKMALKAKQLSKERCEGVQNALLERHRVDAARVEYVGMGWDEPLGTDMDQNRRVEVQWITLE